MRLILALVLVVALSACSPGTDDSPQAAPTSAASSAPPTPLDANGSGVCAEVRAGINAFNAGDFTRTVKHFGLALPLARAQALADPTPASRRLVEAVAYYADLAPEDYPQSARSSLAFARYKAITLGQCVTRADPLDESGPSPGVRT